MPVPLDKLIRVSSGLSHVPDVSGFRAVSGFFESSKPSLSTDIATPFTVPTHNVPSTATFPKDNAAIRPPLRTGDHLSCARRGWVDMVGAEVDRY